MTVYRASAFFSIRRPDFRRGSAEKFRQVVRLVIEARPDSYSGISCGGFMRLKERSPT
jgi:hypothetical protein